MATKNFEIRFKGSIKQARDAVREIEETMVIVVERGGEQPLRFSYSVLAQICKAIDSKGSHYQLYCDIFMQLLAPNIHPASCPKYWQPFLEMLRYFHNMLDQEKRFTEMDRICGWLASIPHKLQNEKDYEFILSMYMLHLTVQSTKTALIFKHISALFEEMLKKNMELNFIYKDFLKIFITHLKQKKIYKTILAQPSSWKMFDSLFELLAGLREPENSELETMSLFESHMDAFIQFANIDAANKWSGEQIALRFLHVCRDLDAFKRNKIMSHALQLLYFFVKFVYAQEKIYNSSHTYYAELCGKFQSFFKQCAETQRHEQWFMEFIVVMCKMLSQIDLTKLKTFSTASLLRAQDGLDQIRGHLLLLMDVLKLAPYITQTSILRWPCCTSVRKHAVVILSCSAIRYYTFFTVSMQPTDTMKSTGGEIEFQNIMKKILRYTVQVITSMNCISSLSPELQSFQQTFIYMLCQVKTSVQAKLCIVLTEQLANMQALFEPLMWVKVLRNLRRATHATQEPNTIAEMHAIQIGYMLKLNNLLDYSALQNEIGILCTAEYMLNRKSCVLELLDTTKSPLKPMLNDPQRRLLHSLETQIVIKYQPLNLPIRSSLLGSSPTQLDYIYVARESKELDIFSQVQAIYMSLKFKETEPGGLKRAEKLTLAHSCTIIAMDRMEKMKKNQLLEQELIGLSEDNLETWLFNDKLKRINVGSETRLIEVVLKALHLYKDFFETADLEPIGSEEFLLDWEALLTDISLMARLLQSRGFLEHAFKAWLLLYNIANFLGDNHNVLRALAFFCEHVEYIENNADIDLPQEVSKKTDIMLNTISNIKILVPRRQNYLLLSLCQLAYYHARQGNLSYALLLLQFVELKRNELPERKDKFDYIMCTILAVKFRIYWKFSDSTSPSRTDDKCLLRLIDATFNRLRCYVNISSEDSLNYIILLFSLLREFSECSINRLCDNNVRCLFVTILKTALEMGFALRIVQSLTWWAMANLQLEQVDKAQQKLKIAECFFGVRNIKDCLQTKPALGCGVEGNTADGHILSLYVNPGMGTMRREAKIYPSPIAKEKLRLTTVDDNRNLCRFLKHDVFDGLSKSDFLQWTFITIGLIKARLLFLIDDFEQLDKFYSQSQEWCTRQKNSFLLINFQNIQLLTLQHYINYLRADRRYSKALEFVEIALALTQKCSRNVDKIYKIIFVQQKQAINCLMLQPLKSRESIGKLRRALEFNLSPAEEKVIAQCSTTQRPTKGLKKIIAKEESSDSESMLNTAIIMIEGDDGSISDDKNKSSETPPAEQKNTCSITHLVECIDDLSIKSIEPLASNVKVRKSNGSSRSSSSDSKENYKNFLTSSLDQQPRKNKIRVIKSANQPKITDNPKEAVKVPNTLFTKENISTHHQAANKSEQPSKKKNFKVEETISMPFASEINQTVVGRIQSKPITSDIVKTIKSIDLNVKTSSELNGFIIEDSPEQNRTVKRLRSKVESKTATKATIPTEDNKVKRRGRPKKIDLESMKENVETKMPTRRR